jgi:Fe-S oxidoreductase/nitrate reductase gamma subunit
VLLTAFDPLLIGVAILLFLIGLVSLRSSWRVGQPEAWTRDRAGDWKGLLLYLLGHRKILENRAAGIAHLTLFWGIFFYLIVAILAQFAWVIPPFLARIFSFVGDVLGISMLAGLTYFLIRRVGSRGPESLKKVVLPVATLLLIVLSGFFAEAARLNLVEPQEVWFTPAGWLVAKVLPASPRFMQGMIRVHFFGVLFFFAVVPFTFMRHAMTGSLNVYYRKRGAFGALRPIDLYKGPLGASSVGDLSWKQLLDAQACVSCGRCDDHCPALISGKPLSPRKVLQDIRSQMDKSSRAPLSDVFAADEIWACTFCMACVVQCPVYAEPPDKIMDLRRDLVLNRGLLPREVRPMIRDLEIFGDVYGKGAAHREDWALHLGIPHISREGLHAKILLWIGCSGAFHPGYQETIRAMVRILQAGKVSFGILGKEERCCGDPARRLGDEERFTDLAMKNIATLKRYNVSRIVCLCPHGFNTLKNEYPPLGGDFEVMHAAEFVMGLIEQKKIVLKYPVANKVAVHDPCYLGRINRFYEPLRALCRAVPGVELRELERNRENTFCCGGGGGRMWLHENVGENGGEKINYLRSREASDSGADLVGTACPYCLSMLEDGINALELENPPKVMDIIEMVASSLGRTY